MKSVSTPRAAVEPAGSEAESPVLTAAGEGLAALVVGQLHV